MAGFKERYEIGDGLCGVIGYRPNRAEAFVYAWEQKRGSHKGCFITVYDRMAHKGAAELWSLLGVAVGWKEQNDD
jgi:hypothetical protein